MDDGIVRLKFTTRGISGSPTGSSVQRSRDKSHLEPVVFGIHRLQLGPSAIMDFMACGLVVACVACGCAEMIEAFNARARIAWAVWKLHWLLVYTGPRHGKHFLSATILRIVADTKILLNLVRERVRVGRALPRCPAAVARRAARAAKP